MLEKNKREWEGGGREREGGRDRGEEERERVCEREKARGREGKKERGKEREGEYVMIHDNDRAWEWGERESEGEIGGICNDDTQQ